MVPLDKDIIYRGVVYRGVVSRYWYLEIYRVIIMLALKMTLTGNESVSLFDQLQYNNWT